MKTKRQINRTSVFNMIDLMMTQTGISREQAMIAFDTILHYINRNSTEPFNKMIGYLFGINKEDGNQSLN